MNTLLDGRLTITVGDVEACVKTLLHLQRRPFPGSLGKHRQYEHVFDE